MLTAQIVGMDRLQRGLRAAPGTVSSQTRQAMTASLLLIEGAARPLAARDTGRLGGSISHTISGQGAALTGRVGPSVRYGFWVEHGRKPGRPPPIDAVQGWAKRHGVSPFAVARAIARKGTKPRPFLVPAFSKNRSHIITLFRQVGVAVVSRIARG